MPRETPRSGPHRTAESEHSGRNPEASVMVNLTVCSPCIREFNRELFTQRSDRRNLLTILDSASNSLCPDVTDQPVNAKTAAARVVVRDGAIGLIPASVPRSAGWSGRAINVDR
jgi:hypothetical protein